MPSVINPASLTALQVGLKYNYAPIAKDLLKADFPLYAMCQERNDFEKDFGGRSMIWALVTDRMHNVGVRDETGFEPGFSGDTNDDIDTVAPVEASLPRAYAYANGAFTTQQMAKAHKSFEQFKGWGFGKHLKMIQDDLGMMLERMLTGDKTGLLGTIVGTPTLSGGNTVCVLQPASTISTRGIAGTQRLAKNMKVGIVRAADWAGNNRLARIHSNIGNSGTGVQKVVAVSNVHDVGAAPTVTLKGDLISAGTALANGDVIVEAKSREENAAGGTSGSEQLKCFDGILSFVDDGTLDTNVFGLSRTTHPSLKSQCLLSNSGRPPTWNLFQVLMDRLERRRGNTTGRTTQEEQHVIFCEKSIKTAFVAQPGDSLKEYIQENKAKSLVSGFNDVTMAFIGNDRLTPFVGYSTMPYGHAFVIRPSTLAVMWDVPPGPIDEDGLTLRKVSGKPIFTYEMQAFGNFRMEEPWLDGRISGLQGTFA